MQLVKKCPKDWTRRQQNVDGGSTLKKGNGAKEQPLMLAAQRINRAPSQTTGVVPPVGKGDVADAQTLKRGKRVLDMMDTRP